MSLLAHSYGLERSKDGDSTWTLDLIPDSSVCCLFWNALSIVRGDRNGDILKVLMNAICCFASSRLLLQSILMHRYAGIIHNNSVLITVELNSRKLI